MYLTFDVGTTSVKTVLFDQQGKVRGKVIRNYTLDTPAVGWIELDPEALSTSARHRSRRCSSTGRGRCAAR